MNNNESAFSKFFNWFIDIGSVIGAPILGVLCVYGGFQVYNPKTGEDLIYLIFGILMGIASLAFEIYQIRYLIKKSKEKKSIDKSL